MTQEEKELLLKDLCARLPYSTLCYCKWAKDAPNGTSGCIDEVSTYLLEELEIIGNPKYECQICEIKPYLRPMSNMTEEECVELSRIRPFDDEVEAWKYIKTPVPLKIANTKHFDFFHSHHLDWRGLIEKGLALEAPENMYNLKNK